MVTAGRLNIKNKNSNDDNNNNEHSKHNNKHRNNNKQVVSNIVNKISKIGDKNEDIFSFLKQHLAHEAQIDNF